MENAQEVKEATVEVAKDSLKFVEAKVILSRDKKQIIHILEDGRAIGKPLGYYQSILWRAQGK